MTTEVQRPKEDRQKRNRRVRSYQRALFRLRDLHAAEFAAIYAEERALAREFGEPT